MSPRIVVGVDGSDTSRRALGWAVDEARLRGAKVEVVHAWHLPYGGFSGPMAALPFDSKPFEEAAHAMLDEVVASVDGHGLPDPIEKHVAYGSGAGALLEAAQDADLLVVGSRGLGGFSGLLLGSVSHQVAHHAPCPVVIVHPEECVSRVAPRGSTNE